MSNVQLWLCDRCGHLAACIHIDGEGFVCDVCLDTPLGHGHPLTHEDDDVTALNLQDEMGSQRQP